MQTVGSDDAGFSVQFDELAKRLRVVGWGFWDVGVAGAFDRVVLDACRGRPPGFELSIDMRELKPMRDEGQAAFANVVRMSEALGVSQTTVITTSHLTKLQLLRIVREAGTAAKAKFM
jgi:hypothetical protein